MHFKPQLQTQLERVRQREKEKNTNLLPRVGGYHQLPVDICKCW